MNLVYFICNKLYKDLLILNLEFLYSSIDVKNTHVLVLADKDLTFEKGETKPDFIHYLKDFDYKYKSKFEINQWERVDQYENFLYLDVDAIGVNQGIRKAFKAAEFKPDIIHCVQEAKSLNSVGPTHKFSSIDYPPNIIGYNAGTFSFNKQCLPLFKELLQFIDTYKELAMFDQPLFNEFLISKGRIEPTLSLFTYLVLELIEDSPVYNAFINKDTKQQASIIHFIGHTYSKKPLEQFEEFLNDMNYYRKKRV